MSSSGDFILQDNVVAIEPSFSRIHPDYPSMKTLSNSVILVCLTLTLHAAPPWRQATVPTVAEAAAAFPRQPTEYGAIHWAI